MATTCLIPSLPLPLRTPSLASLHLHPSSHLKLPKFCCFLHPQSRETLVSSSSPLQLQLPQNKGKRFFQILAVVDEESELEEEIEIENESDGDYWGLPFKKQPRQCELYVFNLLRSCDVPELVEMFEPYGTVISVEVSRNPESGVSRGCGYVTMGSVNSAKNAIAELDGSDVGGREMRVKFSVDMNSGNRNPKALNSLPLRILFYESPYRLYIGNLAWNVKPEELRNQFCRFGTVVSARVIYDRKAGMPRAYAFLSFSSASERDAALSLNGKEFLGRILVIREGIDRD